MHEMAVTALNVRDLLDTFKKQVFSLGIIPSWPYWDLAGMHDHPEMTAASN